MVRINYGADVLDGEAMRAAVATRLRAVSASDPDLLAGLAAHAVLQHLRGYARSEGGGVSEYELGELLRPITRYLRTQWDSHDPPADEAKP